MNVFKLLSRSTEPQPSLTQKLPSSGAVANPQLFGHDETRGPPQVSKKNRKRKRGQDVAGEAPELPMDVDFFGGAHGTSGSTKDREVTRARNTGIDGEDVVHVSDSKGGDTAADEGEESYNEDDCKRVLRSHKLKVVVLEDHAPAEEVSVKEKKKSKKRRREKEEAEKAKKNAKRSLYPRPLTSFAQLRSRYNISRRLAENIAEQGYKVPTEVQLGALPLLLKKNITTSGPSEVPVPKVNASGEELNGEIDLLTVAPTGSGKTIAFLIPIINVLLSTGESESTEGPRAIVVAPTKELASQIVNETRKLAKGTRIKAVLMKKGIEVVARSDDEESANQLDAPEPLDEEDISGSGSEDEALATQPKRVTRRADRVKAAILVATPLALLNALRRRDGSVSELANVGHLVLDEADVLLDPLFREQTLSIWNACTNSKLRVSLWSATMGSNIESLITETINNRWNATSSSDTLPTRSPLIRLVVGLKDSAIPNITHKLIYAATEQGKLLGLRQLLHPTAIPSSEKDASLRPPFLVFTQTIPRAIALHSELLYDIPPEAGGSSRIAVLHAELSSTARENVMTRFRRGEVWVLITTDLLARGVDFRGLNGVVNYDVPNSAAAYVHRVGRTGRAGREGGIAVTYYTQEDIPYIKNIANVIRASEKLRGMGEDEATVKQWLLDALPTPTKKDKQQLKKRGIEARRAVKDGEGRNKMRISTKSGYERRLDNNLRGAKRANKGGRVERKQIEAASESEFEGFEED